MSNDLKSYNQLNYKNESAANADGFIVFLYQNTEVDAPDVDENLGWNRFNDRLAKSKRNFNWLKIAASIAIIFTISFTIYLNNSNPEQLFVSSNGQIANVTFPDGSLGVLNENSSFSYPSKFDNERRVSFKGEAYFDIKKSKKPFIIDVNGVEVKVLGTAFNLISNEEKVALYVDRGLVAFSKNGVETKVKAGLEAIFDKKTNEVTVKETPSSNIMSWRNGYFKFHDTLLKDAIVDLGEYYNVDFKLSNQKLSTCRISATIEQKSLTEVVEILKTILDVKVDVKNKTVKISGQGC